MCAQCVLRIRGTMKFTKARDPILQDLNEYCLLEIFQYLNINEQFTLLKLRHKFKCVVFHIWRRKFSEALNFDSIEQIKLLPFTLQLELYDILLEITIELKNLNLQHLKIFRTLLKNKTYTRIAKVSMHSSITNTKLRQSDTHENFDAAFPKLQNLQMQHLTINIKNIATCRNLNTLELLHCTPQDNVQDFDAIFQQLHLTKFVVLPHKPKLNKNSQQLRAIHCCTSLHILKLHALDMFSAMDAISNLPQLQQLTIFTSTPMQQSRNKDITYCIDQIARCLATSKATKITAIRLKFEFMRYFLRHFRLKSLPNLKEFAWHSHLQVNYATDAIAWQAYDLQESAEVVHFVGINKHLRYLDLSNNTHVTQNFIDKLADILMQHERKCGLEAIIMWDSNKNYANYKYFDDIEEKQFKDSGYVELILRN